MSSKTAERSNQLTNMSEFDVKHMMFSDPVVGAIPNSTLTYRRINISTMNKDKTIGDLIVGTPRLYSYGVSEQKDFNNPDKVNGYSLPLCLADKGGPTKDQKIWIDKFEQIIEKCKTYLLENKEELELYDLTPADFKKFNPIYLKKEKGKVVDGAIPTLYPKLIMSKKQNQIKILSMFFNKDGEQVEPMDYLGTRCYATSAIKLESIYIGSGRYSLQFKLWETEIELAEGNMKPLFHTKKAPTRMVVGSKATNMNEQDEVQEEVQEEAKAVKAGSVENSDAEEEPEEKKVAVRAPVKKVVRKVIKKT